MYHVLQHRVFSVTGDKAASLLHGQLSNSINDLNVGDANYNLLLTQKGKVVADLYVAHGEAGFFCSVAPEFYDTVKNQIAKLAPLSRCVVSDTDLTVIHVFGEQFPDCHPKGFFRTDRYGEPGFDVLAVRDELKKILSPLAGPAASNEQIELLRIKNGIARIGVDVTEKNLPQEGNLNRALHFNKGCYLGQEVIARLHYRGHVNKVLTRFVREGKGFTVGDKLNDGGHECEITSIAFDSNENKTYILAYAPYKNGA